MLDSWNPYPLPPLPEPIARLGDLAYNLWWTWNPRATSLFESLDPLLWDEVSHNPVRLLRLISARRLQSKSSDGDFVHALREVMAELDAYLADETSPLDAEIAVGVPGRIAYFSAEFGVHESLPVYSGGLGVLAGDVCKAASDLKIPLTGVGLLYPQGYFEQRLDEQGRQDAGYAKLNLADAPIRPAIVKGEPVIVTVEIAALPTRAQVWWVQVGRVPLFLLDTDIPSNRPRDREVAYKLYGGGPGMRLRQEMLLGIGGVRAVRKLGLAPRVWHLNEGHAAFAGLELVRELVAEGADFEPAREQVQRSIVFTTHTPVKAGHDEFSDDYMRAHFDGYAPKVGLSEGELLNVGQRGGHAFSMTTLAFAMSGKTNAVSRRHAEVSREMWRELWPGASADGVPIGQVTNGVHVGTWMAPEIKSILSDAGLQPDALHVGDVHSGLGRVDPSRLWHVHAGLRARMLEAVHQREHARWARLEGQSSEENHLNPDALTIVWARRFATYKRAALLFSDAERLAAILSNPAQPVQLVFAGKAHPADVPGQAMLSEVYQRAQEPRFKGRVLFAENYDLALARRLVAGADVWLNTPMAPQEASGTSGQKAALNGVPHLSILDGWWAEGYRGDNGWVIGDGTPYAGESSDRSEADSLYRLLEESVVPLFYDRDPDGVPRGWVGTMLGSIAGALPGFTASRMVAEYFNEMYAPAWPRDP